MMRWAFAMASLSLAHMGHATELPAPTAAPDPPRISARLRSRAPLEQRVEVLSKALDLNSDQRLQLLTILEAQRAAVARIWSDPALLPAERAPATRAIEEHTADQIRAILSEQQKQRYNPKRPQSAQAPSPDVSKWMELTRNSSKGDIK